MDNQTNHGLRKGDIVESWRARTALESKHLTYTREVEKAVTGSEARNDHLLRVKTRNVTRATGIANAAVAMRTNVKWEIGDCSSN